MYDSHLAALREETRQSHLIRVLVLAAVGAAGLAACHGGQADELDAAVAAPVDAASTPDAMGPDAAAATRCPAAPQVLADGLAGDVVLHLDGRRLYWAAGAYRSSDDGTGSVGAVSTDGTHQPVTLADGLTSPTALASDSDYFYWTNQGATAGTGSIMRVDKLGGEPQTLIEGRDFPAALAVDDSHLYWREGTNNSGQGIVRMPKAGGAVDVLIPRAQLVNYVDIAVDDEFVYSLDYSAPRIARTPKAGGQTDTVFGGGGLYPVPEMALKGEDIYFVEIIGRLDRIAKSGPGNTMEHLGSTSPDSVAFMALDDSYAYWQSLKRRIYRIPLGGGDPEPMFDETSAMARDGHDIVVDDQCLYWVVGDAPAQIYWARK